MIREINVVTSGNPLKEKRGVGRRTGTSTWATPRAPSDTSPHSASQIFISEDGVYNTRGRVLGGGSAINAGFYSHAEPEFVRDARWDEDLVRQSYDLVESKVAFGPQVKQWQRR
ncbi:unnamed protein product [Linum tenue]|uniref:Glucose-methanol-choline oxidoreductase N-terminal domain-containing protein n=1 Tax=Linum tenue TaxID=586396 RepID=A0AAV0P040_9ROSI|nr:unnamed protein product [Linum tenue]